MSVVGYVALALTLGSAAHVSTWGLVGPLPVAGMGMGFFVVPVFDPIIASVGDAELGLASGTLNAIQQLGGAVGVAVLGTIFFAAVRRHGFEDALRHTIWWQAAGLGLMLLVSPLLPARARPAAAPAEPAAPLQPPSPPPLPRGEGVRGSIGYREPPPPVTRRGGGLFEGGQGANGRAG